MKEINPIVYFGNREVDANNLPKHFIKSTTKTNAESKAWVVSKLHGRYSINDGYDDQGAIYFEDPKEATIFELRWS
jgi:hypothetical protein